MITPTVGRIVHYYSDDVMEPMCPAIITRVYGPRAVGLAIFPADGPTEYATGVTLMQPEDTPPSHGEFCTWMPYQVKKDTGSESGESEAGVQSI